MADICFCGCKYMSIGTQTNRYRLFFFRQTQPERKRSPLPKLVYSMMSEKDLRKKLKECGLDQKGDKRTMISRLQR